MRTVPFPSRRYLEHISGHVGGTCDVEADPGAQRLHRPSGLDLHRRQSSGAAERTPGLTWCPGDAERRLGPTRAP